MSERTVIMTRRFSFLRFLLLCWTGPLGWFMDWWFTKSFSMITVDNTGNTNLQSDIEYNGPKPRKGSGISPLDLF